MAKKLSPAALPWWPRLMDAEIASSYLAISETAFLNLGVPSLKIGASRRWDIHELNKWIDGCGETAQNLPSNRWLEKFGNVNAS